MDTNSDSNDSKLPKAVASKMVLCPIETVKPYALMMAPAFVYMKLNERFVRVKSCLDFFTPEELEKLKPLKAFFFPEQVENALRFRDVAHQVRRLLRLTPEPTESAGHRIDIQKELRDLAPATYEVSDAILKQMAPLWSSGPSIDPFFATIFVNELCDLLPGEKLKASRDRSMVQYERALICSSWAVFLALHLGYSDLPYLNLLRTRLFDEISAEPDGASPHHHGPSETDQLIRVARETISHGLRAAPGDALPADRLTAGFGRTSQKLASRLDRVGKLANV